MQEEQTLRCNWKKVRHEYGMEKQEFADFLGINRDQYYRYEKGTAHPNLENVLRLAKKVDRPVEYIYELIDTPGK